MNYYVQRYKEQRKNGFNQIEAFGIIASAIAASGTIEDLREVEKFYWNDSAKLDEWEENINESVTRAV